MGESQNHFVRAILGLGYRQLNPSCAFSELLGRRARNPCRGMALSAWKVKVRGVCEHSDTARIFLVRVFK